MTKHDGYGVFASGKTCLDAFIVQRAVDFDVGVRPPVVVALLQVEGVVLVGLVGGAADEAVEYRRVVLDAGAVEGVSIRERKDRMNALNKTMLVVGLVTSKGSNCKNCLQSSLEGSLPLVR